MHAFPLRGGGRVAKWLLDLAEATKQAPQTGGPGIPAGQGKRREALFWRAVATAPAGFAHVRSGMIGTLLEDIEAGLPFPEVKRRFDEKMDPLKYQRPKAAPSAGNIAQAEKIVATLRTAGSLDRRFARIDEVHSYRAPIWSPSPFKVLAPPSGVFSHLQAKPVSPPPMKLSTVKITFEKFRRTVLPTAAKMEVYVPRVTSLASLVTAVNPNSPPMLQWDREGDRNPISWFFYSGGRESTHWGLKGDSFHEVVSVSGFPSNGLPNHAEGVFFLISGAKNEKHGVGGGMFPETLRSEYHSVRSTLEAHFGAASLGAVARPAVGMALTKNASDPNVRVRVTANNCVTEYVIDRWD